ncbi:hypothetical protein ABZ599_16770 [Streptomyces misionensis]
MAGVGQQGVREVLGGAGHGGAQRGEELGAVQGEEQLAVVGSPVQPGGGR